MMTSPKPVIDWMNAAKKMASVGPYVSSNTGKIVFHGITPSQISYCFHCIMNADGMHIFRRMV